MNRALGSLPALLVAAFVAACGGGGGGGTGAGAGTIAATGSFPLQVKYAARIAAGSTNDFSISGDCVGTARITNGAATPATFEGVAGFAATQTTTVNYTSSNCTPATSTASGTTYYDANYTPIGAVVSGLEYSDLAGAPVPLPMSVKVGDSTVYATLTTYTDSTKVVTTGKRALSYVIEADTASTVIVALVAKTSDISDHLLLTLTTRYRIATDGTLTLVSIDVQWGPPTSAHLLYTKT